ncbi:MAG TPA: monovalent cation/H+ antiporter complex subunit F [Limnochordia bacterium]|jgi:multicomponent Na+:H+ antiporter subunit F|nr:cation:proton antiporter [Bacillota bacterium]HKM43326.1 monovalent cation/H+ antiporter complex subunit F [Limnochordia bacterium]
MIETVLRAGGYILIVLMFVCLWRAGVGPSVPDRIVATNLLGTKAVVVLVFVALATEQLFFVDVALVYALINFLTSVGMAKYIEKGKLS